MWISVGCDKKTEVPRQHGWLTAGTVHSRVCVEGVLALHASMIDTACGAESGINMHGNANMFGIIPWRTFLGLFLRGLDRTSILGELFAFTSRGGVLSLCGLLV